MDSLVLTNSLLIGIAVMIFFSSGSGDAELKRIGDLLRGGSN